MLRVLVLASFGCALMGSLAEAEVLTRCGASAGYGYFFEGGLVPADKAGWQEDAIKEGDLQLARDGAEFDIIYSDTAGTRSIRAEGFRVFNFTPQGAANVTLIAVHAATGLVQHYLFQIDGHGSGTVAWGTVRGDGPIAKSSVFVAACSAP